MSIKSDGDNFPFSLPKKAGASNSFSPSTVYSTQELLNIDTDNNNSRGESVGTDHGGNSEVLVRRLKSQFESISALVKDVHEKLNKDLLDIKSVQDTLDEISRNVEKFKNLQKLTRNFEFADDMDEIGNYLFFLPFNIFLCVGLWNTSIAMKANVSNDNGREFKPELIALIRQVGLAMIDAGSFVIQDEKIIVKLLTLATKVGKAWLDCGRSDKADEVLRSANSYEDGVLNIQNDSNTVQLSKCSALVLYYAYRAEAAWKLANSHVANLMIQHATGNIEILCQVCFNIGNQASREGKTGDAIKWLRKCHDLMTDHMKEKDISRTKLLTNTLNILAISYLKNSTHDESSLNLAENSINLCLEEEPTNILASSLKIKILKLQNVTNVTFEETFLRLMKTTNRLLNKENFKMYEGNFDSIKIINSLIISTHNSPTLALSGLDILLEDTLSDNCNIQYIEKAIVAKFHIIGNASCQTLLSLDDAVQSVQVSLDYEQRHGIVISHKAKVACQLILWQSGDRNYMTQKHDIARKWYNLAYKWLASNQLDGKNAATLQRKIALCHLETNHLSDAIEAIQQAKIHEPNCAANFFILYHIAMERGQLAEAIQYLHDMCKGENFHSNMLAMAANEAYQKSNKEVLVEALKEILLKHKKGDDTANVDILVLLRCLIRLTHSSLMSGNDVEKKLVKNHICGYFEIAWNIGLEFCENCEENSDTHAIKLFEIALKFLNSYPEETTENIKRKKICFFTTLSARIFLARQQKAVSEKKDLFQQSLKDIQNYRKFQTKLGKRKRTINDVDEENPDAESIKAAEKSETDALLVLLFEFEAKVNLCLWNELQAILDSAAAYDFDIPSKIYERMAELLIEENECPSGVIFATLQALLDSIMKGTQIDLEQFSRWFRMLVITALVKGKQTALQYFTQALDILNDCSKGKYPEEEIQWLMVTAWNCGIDYYSSNDYPQAKKWCEIAMSFCKYAENGQLYEKEMRKSYGEIMKNFDFGGRGSGDDDSFNLL
ncbi:6719_t:CDS:10 [Ambispora gerdemannii]|uniref:Protein ZIP4 homolog n=1 Tax=Ambispora gerdemannii TaxID=144530 RepID=A0A9N8V0R2_9GLOM|nr:6719_t:CDS:10 [Ambispora gerdemannii]